MKRWRIVLLFLGVVAVGAGLYLWQRGVGGPSAEGAEVLRTAVVESGTLDLTVVTSGNVVARQRAQVGFDRAGVVAEVLVEEGDRVEAGQPLARLECRDLERAVRKAEIGLEEARLRLAQLTRPADEMEIELAQLAVEVAAQAMASAAKQQTVAELQGSQSIRLAEEARDEAKDAYESVSQRLEQAGLPASYGAPVTAAYMEAEGRVGIAHVKADRQTQQARSRWLAAYQNYRQAQEQLRRLQEGPEVDEVRRVRLQIEQARLALEQAQAALAQATLEAPIAGVVAAVNVQKGLPTVAGGVAVLLLDDSIFYVDVTVDELEVGRVAKGAMAEVTLDAYPGVVLTGTVTQIAAMPTNVGGLIAYQVRVQLNEAKDVIVRDGMTANVVIHVGRVEDVLLVPNWAVRTDQESGETYAYVLRDGVPVRVVVRVGERDEHHTAILDGLVEGEKVALVVESRSLLEMRGPPHR